MTMHVDVRSETFRDKVLGCWIGKNCGGTLGTPLEEGWGRDEPFDVWWYPELQSGGLPNDDLEMQLVWLAALRDVGPELRAADLATYWLDHIGYNFDEYGLSKTNLRLGLRPPVSGAFNNWFVDCMGCPIRSEVWACVTPGHPRIAARYAYEDAICDHAGGESVYGELFNAALESAAFVVEDRDLLLDIATSYVPQDSATRRAIDAARAAHAEGVDWVTARRRVIDAAPSKVAQYSPINLGFQVIGWLYGKDFGEAMCITVNCGYDTDSSGGTIGSWLGVRAGLSNLPEKWTEPFGMGLSTNESWGGVRHLSDGARGIPGDVPELTDEIVRQAERVLLHHGVRLRDGAFDVDVADLYADDAVRELWSRPVTSVSGGTASHAISVDYGPTPVVRPGEDVVYDVAVTSHLSDPVRAVVSAVVPGGWRAPEPVELVLDPHATSATKLALPGPARAAIARTNPVLVSVQVDHMPVVPPVPAPLVGAQAWRVLTGDAGVVDGPADLPDRSAAGPAWREIAVDGNELPLESLRGAGDVVLQTFLQAFAQQQVRLAVDASVAVTVWADGEQVIDLPGGRMIRPSYGSTGDVGATLDLAEGFHEVVVRFRFDGAAEGASPALAHVLLFSADRLKHGDVTLGRTTFPWDD
ncbi:ADP-ribosylation/Crystallin J1 [Beutenbergia cavernae DSM 12333]|uniref:ADP-ribosylation/Crystallin J1 n=1 Tax=Beutenbergia cavernae (strain ATCC BAA-8 / DSM 12333 / CCUG 43141 / JCM 11478 / NBRC 16432 / NCIMB 13614 / HKI 0122) TaxID=471853 RepID=C5BWB9_BEUC1|nr:ADP-ribosylglycohydrolase family protein [Beutenbergia cavernae]ACQ78577.1 ADP-ribosylation/Crystallin J1 [Beutenbergia cavernae DSM 12333]